LRAFLERMAARGVPLALAVIPSALDPALAELVEEHSHVSVLVHGWRHVSHAPAGTKTSEYPPGRDSAELERELGAARDAVEAVASRRFVPVFVPPWNRMAEDAVALLAGAGYRALSVMARSRKDAPPSRLDVHWDPVDWRGSRGLGDEVALLDRLSELLREGLEPGRHAPLGLLTHHAVHDGWIDRFCDDVLDRLRSSSAVRFVAAREALNSLSPHEKTGLSDTDPPRPLSHPRGN
jgi:peptidoglycan/xylan/chitin deacetylase (PgdA/CDA1 family)